MDVEVQPFLGFAGKEVHLAAYRPKKVFGLQELGVFFMCEHALLGEFFAAADPVEILADPEQRLQIA